MALQRNLERIQEDIKELQRKSNNHEYLFNGIATREYVDHGILGRRRGSSWSNKGIFLEPVDETTPKNRPPNDFHAPNEFHDRAHWATLQQAYEQTASKVDAIKAQYCRNTDSRNPVGQTELIQSYSVEKLQEVFTLVSPKQLPHMSAEVRMICEGYMNLRVASGIDDYILRTRTPKLSKTIQMILRPYPAFSKQCESYNLYDVCFLLRQKIDHVPEPQKSEIVENWRSQIVELKKYFYFLKRQKTARESHNRLKRKRKAPSEIQNHTSAQPSKPVDPLKPEIDYRTEYEPLSTSLALILRRPLHGNSLEPTKETKGDSTAATSSPSMAEACSRPQLRQDPIRSAKWWTSLRPPKNPLPLNSVLPALFSPLVAKRCDDPKRPVKHIGPISLREPWPRDRVGGFLWKHGLRLALRRKI